MMGFFRAAFVIGRRDFMASVFSRYFIFFLMSPLIILGMSVAFGSVTQTAAKESTHTSIAVIAKPAESSAIKDAAARLSRALGEGDIPDFVYVAPEQDRAVQTKRLLGASDERILAVLSGGLDQPVLTGAVENDGAIEKQVGLVLDEARRERATARSGIAIAPARLQLVHVTRSAGAVAAMRGATATAGQLFLFMLTVLLSGMLLSNMLEEKSNKIIEVLAAAVPVDAIFFGKIMSMLAISLIGVTVWAGGGLAAASLLGWEGAVLPEPAVGWFGFLILLVGYFATNYLLLGAVFLGIGSQAASVREVQTLSMPITVGQMLIFAFASLAVHSLDSPMGIAAAVFPFSSPLMMIARAAQEPSLWPHLLAFAWLALWVWAAVRLGSALFRRNVLKSGGRSRARA